MSFISPLPCGSGDSIGSCCPTSFTGFCLEDGTPISIVIDGGVQTGWINLETGVTTPGPPPAGTEVCLAVSTDCCPATFTGFCLEDETPIGITIENGIQVSWINLETGVTTPGPPPSGTHICNTGGESRFLDCDTDSITVCQDPGDIWSVAVSGTFPITIDYSYSEDSSHLSGDIGAFVLAVRNDAGTPLAGNGDYIPFTTDSTGALRVTGSSPTINFEYPEDSFHVSGDIGAFTLGVRNDTAAVLTSGDGDYSPFATDSAGRIGISDLSGSLTVDAIDLDIRNLSFATDKVDVSGSTVTIQEPLSVDDNGGSLTVDGTVEIGAASLAALESITVQNPGGASAVNIQDGGNSITVDGTVTADINFDYPEDSLHVSGDIGAFVLAVRNDAGTPLAGNGDYIPFTTDATGALRTSVVSAGGTFTTDYSYPEDSAHISGAIGAFTLGVRNDTAAILTDLNGDYSPFATDSAGRIGVADLGGSLTVDQGTSPWVTSLDATTLAALESITVQNPGGASAVNIQDGGNSITVDGTLIVNQGTSPWVTSLDATSLAALESITVQNPGGVSAVNIQDGGNSITVDGAVTVSGTVATNSERAEDSGHTSGQIGNFILAVRNDAGTSLVDTTLDYAPLQVNSIGELRVTTAASASPTGRDDTDNQVPVATGLNTDVSRNYIYDGANWDRWTGAITDGGGSLTVDGTVTVNQGTSPWVTSLDAASLAALESITVQNPGGASAVNIQDGGNVISIDDAAGSITIDNATLAVVGGGTEATALRVTIANDSTGVLSVDDNGGSLTVDGTVAVTQGTSPWVTSLDATTLAALESITVQNPGGASAVNIQDGGNSITVDGTVTVTDTSGTITNGAETAVSSVAVQVLAANGSRKKYLIENTGLANVRVGVTGVTATTGFRLIPGGSLLMEMPNCPTQAIFAIRETVTDSIVFAQEVT